jgi:hypothetical protein
MLYYFNVHSGDHRTEDEDGMDLPDLDAAHREAITRIRSLLSDDAMKGMIDLRGWISVTDTAGKMVISVPFCAAVKIVQPERQLEEHAK